MSNPNLSLPVNSIENTPWTGGVTIRNVSHFDLCLTWCWEYDADFMRLLESACQANGQRVVQVTSANLEQMLAALETGELTFGAYLDRTEHEAKYLPFSRWARENGCYRINPKEAADFAEDKANMHPELVKAGLQTPNTIILPSWNDQPRLPEMDLRPLGEFFVIKPSYGGGGEGVVMGATSLEQVAQRRTEYPHLRYLLQQTIEPQKLEGRDAWFRIIFCDGLHYPCWWDPTTHIYTSVTSEEEAHLGLTNLRDVTCRIAELCQLGFFSTEIALDQAGRWVVIDYVNDQIDMRLQSMAQDGVPDEVVRRVSLDLAGMVKRNGK